MQERFELCDLFDELGPAVPGLGAHDLAAHVRPAAPDLLHRQSKPASGISITLQHSQIARCHHPRALTQQHADWHDVPRRTLKINKFGLSSNNSGVSNWIYKVRLMSRIHRKLTATRTPTWRFPG
jgi:hypothetical protein